MCFLSLGDTAAENWKIQTLPLARIKKIMKSEEIILQEIEKEKQQKAAEEGQTGESEKSGVKFMISGEAPVLMSKACELLIRDLSFRAWRHTERNRRRTLQRQDLHAAVGESEVYDFLIDIVPRVSTAAKTSAPGATEAAAAAAAAVMAPPMPSGIPQMGGIPGTIPGVPGQQMGVHVPPPGSQPLNNMMDLQQMQQQPQQLQQGLVQFPDQQHAQHYQNFMSIPQIPGDMGQNGGATTSQVQQTQATTQWIPQTAASNSGSSQQSLE